MISKARVRFVHTFNYADMHHYPSYFSDIERHFILVALNNKHFYYSLFLRSLQ
ncbi:Uncharacterised protein [Enterobacter cloacae]|jgi:hypothetical protein|uniref:Uncharacterized protein n=1 Tax=Enterobacter cloacae TaxID=550 RepID=A0A377M1S5_ENTCL|nr:Uncharacterised protein [Enterobacter cloacae]